MGFLRESRVFVLFTQFRYPALQVLAHLHMLIVQHTEGAFGLHRRTGPSNTRSTDRANECMTVRRCSKKVLAKAYIVVVRCLNAGLKRFCSLVMLLRGGYEESLCKVIIRICSMLVRLFRIREHESQHQRHCSILQSSRIFTAFRGESMGAIPTCRG